MALHIFTAVRLRFCLITLLMLICTNEICESRTSNSLKVTLTHGGVLVGRHLTSHKGRSVRAYLGVPYAKPPLGNLRFKSPIPYGRWIGEKIVIKDSPKCIQRDPYRRDIEIEGSEDCLYLNVFVPEIQENQYPLAVMVWFHGGGYQCGSGISSFYGSDFLMDRDIVYVSANFRLGPLGFLSSETLDCPGNFGLKDQVEVLKWVQANIGSFGGDPNCVTIFGESAGGASVTYHMLSEQSRGLFHKGISQSGTYFNPWAQPAYKGVAAKRAHQVAKLLSCDEHKSWNEILTCLRQKPANDVVATVYNLFEWDFDPMIPFPVVIEPEHKDAFLTISPRSKNNPHGFSLPLMIGATSDEGLLKTAPLLNLPGLLDEFKKQFDRVLPIILNYDHHSFSVQKQITNKIKEFYFKKGHTYHKQNHQNITDLISDGWFISGIDEYLRIRIHANIENSRNSAKTYVYLFDHKGAASFSELFRGGREDYYGTCHAEELQYIFPIGRELFVSAAPTSNDILIREALLTLWTDFAKTSNPTPKYTTFPNWLPTETYPVSYVRFGSKSSDHWSLITNDTGFFQTRTNFWYNLAPHVQTEDFQSKDEL